MASELQPRLFGDDFESLPSAQDSPKLYRVAIVRHGDYNSSYRLSERGQVQIETLGKMLKTHLTPGELATILSSTAPRALDSSEVLAKVLGIPVVEPHLVLWSDNNHQENFAEAYQLVNAVRRRAHLAILVTHYEYAEGFPSYLCERDLQLDVPYKEIGKGQGVLIDYKAKQVIYLR